MEINNFETKITLKVQSEEGQENLDSEFAGEESEEFNVNWEELEFLCQDLSKIEEYDIPLIIFNFNLIKGK